MTGATLALLTDLLLYMTSMWRYHGGVVAAGRGSGLNNLKERRSMLFKNLILILDF